MSRLHRGGLQLLSRDLLRSTSVQQRRVVLGVYMREHRFVVRR
jgi:hypothetical protein